MKILLALFSLILSAPLAPPPQDGGATAPDPSAAAPAAPEEPSADAKPALPEGVIASLDGDAIGNDAFLAYLGTVFARKEPGRDALRQLLVEAVLESRAGAAGVSVGQADVDALYEEFEARARAASGGTRGLLDSAGGPGEEARLQHTLRMAALQRAVVADEDGVDDPSAVDEARLGAWIQQAMTDAELAERALGDPLAATWSGGQIPRVAVGVRLTQNLPGPEVASVLTELIGILAIFRRAEALGLEYTPEAAAAELAERERLVAASPEAAGITYASLLAQVEGITPAELVSSPRFQAEVLVAELTERQWGASALAGLFEELRPQLVERFGEGVSLAEALPTLQKEARQRTYRQIVESSTIVRRF